nr:hypothetical protein CFP56_34696 [Quercus suber]
MTKVFYTSTAPSSLHHPDDWIDAAAQIDISASSGDATMEHHIHILGDLRIESREQNVVRAVGFLDISSDMTQAVNTCSGNSLLFKTFSLLEIGKVCCCREDAWLSVRWLYSVLPYTVKALARDGRWPVWECVHPRLLRHAQQPRWRVLYGRSNRSHATVELSLREPHFNKGRFCYEASMGNRRSYLRNMKASLSQKMR